ncbi:MAG: phosphoribosylanthranilate isomerase [Bacteroidota bacterium]
MLLKPFIQVAGIIDQAEADMLVRCGVKYLGFPLRLDFHKEDLSDDEAAKIIRSLPEGHHGVLITYLKTADEINELLLKIGANHVQIHGEISLKELQKLRRIRPDAVLLKSLVIRQNNLNELIHISKTFSSFINYFITDTYDETTGASGATGKMHDLWKSGQLVENSLKPVVLAGGLRPKNVREAIIKVRPSGVDVHTGVENSDGRKDETKVREFLKEAEKGFKEIGF